MALLEIGEAKLAYIAAAMFVTFVLQFFVTRHTKRKRIVRITEAMICQLLTVSVSLPMLEFFPELPSSTVLIIGAVIGVLGVEGWENLAHGIISLLFNHVTGYQFHFSHRDTTEVNEDNDEPPSPIKRKKDASK